MIIRATKFELALIYIYIYIYICVCIYYTRYADTQDTAAIIVHHITTTCPVSTDRHIYTSMHAAAPAASRLQLPKQRYAERVQSVMHHAASSVSRFFFFIFIITHLPMGKTAIAVRFCDCHCSRRRTPSVWYQTVHATRRHRDPFLRLSSPTLATGWAQDRAHAHTRFRHLHRFPSRSSHQTVSSSSR